MRDTLGVLLAGGAGERLYPLTRDRAKPAVTFGGIYRIIDITLSNCINSDLRRVYILTQYKALSLNRHIREGWGNIVGRELGEFIEILPPMKRVSENWYMGTADAVYQNIYSIGSEQPRYVLILSGDHIYKMNYDLMLRQHKDSGADVTLATILIDPAETRHFGVVEIDRTGRVVGFQEKPEETDLRSPYNPRMVSASMGVYLFNTDVLIPVLLKDAEDPTSRHDFGHNILPRMVGRLQGLLLQLHRREPQGSALLARCRNAGSVLRSQHGPGLGGSGVQLVRQLPGRSAPTCGSIRRPSSCSTIRDAPARPTIPSSPWAASSPAARCATSVLSPDVRVNSYAQVDTSILCSHVNVGRHCRIRKAIIDRDVQIPEGTVIGYDTEADRQKYHVTDSGITVVTRDYSLFENPITVDYFTSE